MLAPVGLSSDMHAMTLSHISSSANQHLSMLHASHGDAKATGASQHASHELDILQSLPAVLCCRRFVFLGDQLGINLSPAESQHPLGPVTSQTWHRGQMRICRRGLTHGAKSAEVSMFDDVCNTKHLKQNDVHVAM